MPINIKRTFIALKVIPDKSFINDYNLIKKKLNQESIRWINTENLHVTLRFLGDTKTSDIEIISRLLDDVAYQSDFFSFILKGVDVFRSIWRPRVIWMGLDSTVLLNELKIQVDRSISSLCGEQDDSFNPHLTLGRTRAINNVDRLKSVINEYRGHIFQEVFINELIFYESILSSEGASYSVLSSHKLSGKSNSLSF